MGIIFKKKKNLNLNSLPEFQKNEDLTMHLAELVKIIIAKKKHSHQTKIYELAILQKDLTETKERK